MIELIEAINPWAWSLSNVLLVYSGLALIIFGVMYYVFFDPKSTTGGRLIFRFAVSLGIVKLFVIIGIFFDSPANQDWYAMPYYIAEWRPLARLIGYAYVSYAVTSLNIYLIVRRWWPHMVRKRAHRLAHEDELAEDTLKPRY